VGPTNLVTDHDDDGAPPSAPTPMLVNPARDASAAKSHEVAPIKRLIARHARVLAVLNVSRVGLVVAFGVVVATFWSMRPQVFSEWTTWRGIFDASAIPAIIAMTLTVTLIVGDFDLSIGATLGLTMAVSVTLMANHSVGWPIAALSALGAAAAVGLVNGVLITWARVNSFIATLAVSSIVGGLDAKVSEQQSITNGIPSNFVDLGLKRYLGISVSLWAALLLGLVLYVAVSHTETGRYLFAVGGNREAARLSGVRVRWLRTIGMISAALGAAVAGVLLAAQTASYYPNAGGGYLLPAYAAAFLGTAAGRGRFGILATAFGVFFLQTLQTGLTVLNVQPWIVLVVQGSVLAIAVMVSTLGTGVRRPTFPRLVQLRRRGA
jgi:ribose transport system permease protein